MTRTFASKVAGCNRPELAVDEREEAIEGSFVATAPLDKQVRDVVIRHLRWGSRAHGVVWC